ncbi:MAG: InlB B-repeat-containing protein, partial [Lachnospiraceae bacterium]|nr:InlB B-repeat-containing protein [Lachnospiraceae bacterium]
MKKERIAKIGSKVMSLSLCFSMVAGMTLSNCTFDMFRKHVDAAVCDSTMNIGSGSIGIGTNHPETKNLPVYGKQGTYRTTTTNYNNNHAALDTNDWASSWVWNYEGTATGDSTNALTGTAYAFPNCYYYLKDGLRAGKPSMVSSGNSISAYANKLTGDTLIDFKIFPGFTPTNVNTDVISDWSYQAIATNGANNSQTMKMTMTQGSPFLFLELNGTTELNIQKLRNTFSGDVVMNEIVDGARVVVFRVNDNVSPVNGYSSLKYGYYAMYLPQNTQIQTIKSTSPNGADNIGTYKFSLPSGNKYATFASLYDSENIDDNTAKNIARTYRNYAFNFITDTKATYSYNEATSKVTTTYTYTVSKKSESKADGTVMGILPHQYKNMSGYNYLSNRSLTLRGYMKFLTGSSYQTVMTFNGIIPYMPDLSSTDEAGKAQLQEYVNEFVRERLSGSGNWTLTNDESGDTYWHGKKLNRSAQVIAAAKSLGDEESAEKILDGLEANLAEWFTYSGEEDKTYFTYYGNGVGTLLGIQGSFNSIDQINDHHFHYGYYIGASAMVGLWDKQWLEQYKDVIKQVVYDIACPYRNTVPASTYGGNAYPYLRSFAPYEGHSWASGYEDSKDGNNQESTSESINAWASVILLGEMIGDKDIRDMGIYLYETEIASANAYWFDQDEDIYKVDNCKLETPCVGMVWGGKADYQTYFGIEYTQGIQICPMQSWSFYLLDGGQDYVQKFFDYDKNGSVANGGSVNKWNDLWSEYYALINPSKALNEVWLKTQVNDGESHAHTYHFMKALDDYGTPDTGYTANTSMYSAFVKNGVTTFAVYNPSSVKKSVTFTAKNGTKTTFSAKPMGMTVYSSNNVGKAEYTTEYYGKNLGSNTYTLMNTEINYANANTTVNAKIKDFTGFVYDSGSSNKIVTSTVKADGSTVLKVYYNREVYSVNYELNGGSKNNSSLYTSSYTYGETYSLDEPVRAKYDFAGWYLNEDFSGKITSIKSRTHGNMTLYARWMPKGTIKINDDIYMVSDTNGKSTFVVVGDKKFDAVSILYRIYDDEESARAAYQAKNSEGYTAVGLTANDIGWVKQMNFAKQENKYIVFFAIRYQNGAGYGTG